MLSMGEGGNQYLAQGQMGGFQEMATSVACPVWLVLYRMQQSKACGSSVLVSVTELEQATWVNLLESGCMRS